MKLYKNYVFTLSEDFVFKLSFYSDLGGQAER